MIEAARYFNAPWGTLLKVISILGTLLLIGIFGSMILSGQASTLATVILYSLIPVLTLFISMLQSVEYDPKAMTGSLRTFGNGGLFSFSGSYRSGKLGSFKAYVSDFKKCVVIIAAGQTVVVSPENPELFVEVLRNLQIH